jgi:hypothetical protein
MEIKKFAFASISVFFIFAIVDLIFDLSLLMPINMSLSAVWRPVMIRWLEPAIYLYIALLFVFIFAKMNKSADVKGGIIFGLLIGLLVSGVLSFKQYALYPIPFKLSVLWYLEGIVQYVLAGTAAALIYRPKT